MDDLPLSITRIRYAVNAYIRDGPRTQAEEHLKKNAIEMIIWLLDYIAKLREK